MKRKNNLLSLMLCVSLALHGVIFFLVPLYPVHDSRLPMPNSINPFSLVNLDIIEPAAPLPTPREPRVPTPPAPPPEAPEPLPENITEIEPAENFIAMAEPVPENIAENTASEAGPSLADTTVEAALAEKDEKRNNDYIRSRILSKLVYPPEAFRAGLTGTAEVSFTIHEDGTVSDVVISRSSGKAHLDSAALDTIYAAAPFKLPHPVKRQQTIPVTFKIRNR
jgi:protein TonB